MCWGGIASRRSPLTLSRRTNSSRYGHACHWRRPVLPPAEGFAVTRGLRHLAARHQCRKRLWQLCLGSMASNWPVLSEEIYSPTPRRAPGHREGAGPRDGRLAWLRIWPRIHGHPEQRGREEKRAPEKCSGWMVLHHTQHRVTEQRLFGRRPEAPAARARSCEHAMTGPFFEDKQMAMAGHNVRAREHLFKGCMGRSGPFKKRRGGGGGIGFERAPTGGLLSS